MKTKTNYELLLLFKRLTKDGLNKFADQVQEEIYSRMESEC